MCEQYPAITVLPITDENGPLTPRSKAITSRLVPIIRELPQHIRQLINRRRHQPHDRLKRRLVRRARVASGRDELLGPLEGRGHALRVLGGEGAVERG